MSDSILLKHHADFLDTWSRGRSNGPVPMEVGAIKGSDRKGDKGKKCYGKGKHGESFGKFGAKGEYSKRNECDKSY